MNYIDARQADKIKPIEIYKCDDRYVLANDENHRVAAAQKLNRPVHVKVTVKYKEQSQIQDKEEEMRIASILK